MGYPVGKLPNAVLTELLARSKAWTRDPRVLVGPRPGEDAAVLDFGANLLVVSTDPITFATDQLGWYAVQVNANDIAVRGARPRWFLAVALLPPTPDNDALARVIFEQIESACADLGCALIGGHTEITLGLDRPIVVGQMLGEVTRDRLVTTGGAQVGDLLLLTKGLAIEGTALLAREGVLSGVLREDLLATARNLLFAPGISVVREALAASRTGAVHAMHDPTEGGLATALAELAQAAGVGVRVDQSTIPILPETDAVCRALGLDPLGLLASGALILSVAPDRAASVGEAIGAEGIACAQIGEVVPGAEGLKLATPAGLVPLPAFARDELARALASE